MVLFTRNELGKHTIVSVICCCSSIDDEAALQEAGIKLLQVALEAALCAYLQRRTQLRSQGDPAQQPSLPVTCCCCSVDDEAASQEQGSEAGGNQSDFQRGRRLRKLARMLNSKPAQKVGSTRSCA